MNSSYLNAAGGAFLAVVFVVMTVSIASDAIFHSAAPEAEGYALVPLEGGGEAQVAAGSEGLPPIAPLLVDASVEGGERAFRKCAACHTVEDGGANRVGPNLWNIVDRPIAAADTGFGFSSALTDFSKGGEEVWDYDPPERIPRRSEALCPRHGHGFRRPEEGRRAGRRHRLSAFAFRQPGPAAEPGTGSHGHRNGRYRRSCARVFRVGRLIQYTTM